MTWTDQAPSLVGAFVGVIAVFILPGTGLLWLARVRGLLAWALGPAVSALLYGTAAVALDKLGLPWGLPAVIAAAVPAAAVAVLLGRWRRHDPPLRTAPLPTVVVRAAWVAALTAGLILVIGVCAGMPDPAAPLQVRDAVVHLNGLALVRQEHNASMFGALDVVVSSAGTGAFYPSLWHGALALVPIGSVGVVSNAALLAVATVLWPLAMVALARAVLPARPWVVVVVAALSTAFSFFPFGQLVLSAQWPNGLGGAMIPAVLAAMIVWVRSWHDNTLTTKVRRRRALTGAVVVVAAVGGTVLVHPNTVFSLLVFAGPFLGAVVWRAWGERRRTGRTVAWVVACVVVGAALVVAAARVTGLDQVLKNVMAYQQILPERSYVFTVSRLLGDTTLRSVPGNVFLSVLVLTGVVVAVRERRLRWVVFAWGLTIVLAALAGGPENGLRGITGFWYKHVFRLEALYPITALLLAAVGVAWWADHLHTRWVAWATMAAGNGGNGGSGGSASGAGGVRAVYADALPGGSTIPDGAVVDGAVVTGGGAVVDGGAVTGGDVVTGGAVTSGGTVLDGGAVAEGGAVSGVGAGVALRGVGRLVGSPLRAGATVLVATMAVTVVLGVPAMAVRSGGVYDPDHLGARLLVSDDDRRLLDRLPTLVPADGVVLGDPNAGAVLAFSHGSRTPVYYRIGADWLGADQRLLTQRFDAIAEDPAVCEALGRLGVEYFYLSSDRDDQTWPDNRATHALRAVDTSSGFELLASEGAAQLFRITACG